MFYYKLFIKSTYKKDNLTYLLPKIKGEKEMSNELSNNKISLSSIDSLPHHPKQNRHDKT
jgi:hypothetical protein